MDAALAQAEPAAVLLRLAKRALRQRRQVDLHRERNFDLDARQGRRLRGDLGGRWRRAPGTRGWNGAWLRRGSCSCLARCRGFAGRARTPQGDGRRSTQDGVERRDQPLHAREAARKDRQRRPPADQPVPLQERLGRGAPAKLIERKRAQKMCSRGTPQLGEPIEQDKRPPGLAIEHPRGGGHQQNGHVPGAGRNRFLRQRQDARARACDRKRLEQPIGPDVGRVRLHLEQVRLAQCRTCHRPRRPASPHWNLWARGSVSVPTADVGCPTPMESPSAPVCPPGSCLPRRRASSPVDFPARDLRPPPPAAYAGQSRPTTTRRSRPQTAWSPRASRPCWASRAPWARPSALPSPLQRARVDRPPPYKDFAAELAEAMPPQAQGVLAAR